MSDESTNKSTRRDFLAMAGAALGMSAIGAPAFADDDDYVPETPDDWIIPVDHHVHPTLATNSTAPVGIVIGCGLDISHSVEDPEYRAQLSALANAIERPDFRESIFMHGGPGSAALFVADFDAKSRIMLPAIDFRENDPAKFSQVADIIRGLPRRYNWGGTKQHTFLHNAMRTFNHMPWHCRQKHAAVLTDGSGDPNPTAEARLLMGSEHGASVSSLVTRIGNTHKVYECCQANLTTPPNAITAPTGGLVPAGITVEVATELQTTGSEQEVARHRDELFLALRQLILIQTAGIDPRYLTHPALQETQYAALDTQLNGTAGPTLPRRHALGGPLV